MEEEEIRKTVREYEKWKLGAGKSPDVNANGSGVGDRDLSRERERRGGGERGEETRCSIGARARLGRERALTGTTRRAFSPRGVIARQRRRGILGILLRNASHIQRGGRKRAAANYLRNLRKNIYALG